MIPVKLTLKGVYSYQDEQSIDFTRLTGAGLFGIFGPVGSGKSTILEAMSFALFDRIDRLKGDKRNYNMMNLKSDSLQICFEFLANDGMKYRIEVTGRRNRKNFNDVPTFKRGFYSLAGDTWIPMKDTTAETVTGLSYDNFHRTIIIPQGRFQEFLQLNVKERVTMLKELFSLNKYDLFDKTASLESENNKRLENLAGQLIQLGTVNPDDLTALKSQAAENQKLLGSLSAEMKNTRARDTELEELRKLSAETALQKEKVTSLLAKEPGYILMEKGLKEYENFFIVFHSDLEQHKVFSSSLENQSADLRIKKEEYQRLSVEWQSGEARLKDLKPGFDNREELLRKAEEFNKLAQIRKLEEVARNILLESVKEKNDLKTLEVSMADAKETLRESAGRLMEMKKNLPDIKLLSEIKNWFREEKNLKEQIAAENIGVKRLTEKLNENRASVFNLAAGLITITEPPETFDPERCFFLVEEARTDTENELKKLGPEVSELEIQRRLEEFAGELQEGRPCPLCGSTEHPQILDIHDVSEKLEMVRRKKDDLELEIKRFIKGEKEFGILMKEIALTENNLKTRLEAAGSLAARLEEHHRKFVWEGFHPGLEQPVDEGIKVYDSLSRGIADMEFKINDLNKLIADLELKHTDLLEKIRADENKINGYMTEAGLLSGQLAILKKDDWTENSPGELEKNASFLKRDYHALTEDYKRAEENVKILQSKADTTKGTIVSLENQIETLRKQKDELSERINGSLARHGGVALSYVEEVLGRNFDLEKTRREIAQFRTDLQASGSQLQKLEALLAGREYPSGEHRSVKELLKQIQSQIEEKNQQMGRLNATLSTLETNLKLIEKLKKEQHALLLMADNLSTLKNLFRGAAFVNFASRAYLENIVVAANIRFRKLTRQHLELIIDEDNNFMIRDHMNEGKLRSVKTLSGGQIFQASLSLALALADNVNRQAEADQNFFFLDEGFGSLDKESLGVVFETLKSLHKENRIVGVISHVEEMQQEIDAHLVVSLDEEHGSRIISSLY